MQTFKQFFNEGLPGGGITQPATVAAIPAPATRSEDKMSNIDKLQAALDIAGFEPTVGTGADAANAAISALRMGKAAIAGKGDKATEHALNAGISAISMIPFADVIKVLKLRKLGKPAVQRATAAARRVKIAGSEAKKARAIDSAGKLTGGSKEDIQAAADMYKTNMPNKRLQTK